MEAQPLLPRQKLHLPFPSHFLNDEIPTDTVDFNAWTPRCTHSSVLAQVDDKATIKTKADTSQCDSPWVHRVVDLP